jgi:hypothetical protein
MQLYVNLCKFFILRIVYKLNKKMKKNEFEGVQLYINTVHTINIVQF